MPIREWEYYTHLQHYARLRGEFCVGLKPWGSGKKLSKHGRSLLADQVLEPLRKRASSVFLYDPDLSAPVFQALEAPYKKLRGKILFGDTHISAFLPVMVDPWAYGNKVRGSILFELDDPGNVWEDIFPHCYDPTVVTNIISCFTAASVHYARRKRKDGKTFVLVNHGVEDLLIIPPSESLSEIVAAAAEHCLAGKTMVSCYGPGAELAPLDDHVTYGTGFPE